MKSILNRVVVLLVMGTLTSVLALGKTLEKKVTFRKSVSVNGTLIEKGTYKVTFNDETGELSIKKGDKVVVTAQAQVQKTDLRHNFYTDAASDDPAKAPALVSLTLKEGTLATIVNSTANKGPNERQ
jgi:hypothetical protein